MLPVSHPSCTSAGQRGAGHWSQVPSRAIGTARKWLLRQAGLQRLAHGSHDALALFPVFLLSRFLSDDRSLEYKYYKLKLAEMQRQSQTLVGADGKPLAAECAVRAMLYARAVRGLKKRILPGRRCPLPRAQRLRSWKARRVSTGTQTLLSSGTRLKHHGQQAPGALRGKLRLLDRSIAAKTCPPGPASPALNLSPAASVGAAVSYDLKASSPCKSSDGESQPRSPSGQSPRAAGMLGHT